jgi:type IV pilus assembly protein PilC
MPVYKYVAKNKDAQTLSGSLEAKAQSEAEGILRSMNLIIISLRETQAKGPLKKKLAGRVGLDDLVIFSRQLATMIDSGMTLVASLDILRSQTESKVLAQIIHQIYGDVDSGKSFCDAIAKYPTAFSEFYINMIKAGEASGTLDAVLC